MTRPKAVRRPPGEPGDLWEVAVALPIFHTLTYRLPEDLKEKARVGSPVRVPAKRRVVTGYLLGPARETPEGAIRSLQEVLDTPPRRLSAKAQSIIAYLQENGPTSLQDLNRIFPRCSPILKRLEARSLVALEHRAAWRDPLANQPPAPEEAPLQLSPDQEERRAAIVEGIRSRAFSPFLLHRVTASGKTEVYLAAAQATLDQERQVLVLLPEIALNHPVALAFRRRFGSRVALLHSGISPAARLDQWRALLLGQVDIAVGARSAGVAPLA